MRAVLYAALFAMAVALSLAFAHVVSVYPIRATFEPTNPKVVFLPGNNAGVDDISGTIGVAIGAAKTSLTLELHPTYQVTYYKNVTIINNSDSRAYTVTLKVEQPINITQWVTESSKVPLAKVLLIVYPKDVTPQIQYQFSEEGFTASVKGSGIKVLDLTSTDNSVSFLLDGETFYQVDVLVVIPEPSTATSTALPAQTANVILEATPSS